MSKTITIEAVIRDNAEEPHVAVEIDGVAVAWMLVVDGNLDRAEELADAFIARVLLA